MTHRYIKIGITTLVLALAFGGLLWSTLTEGAQYFKHVDEVMVAPEQWQGKQMQLHGFVVAKSIFMKPATLEYKFKVQHNGAVVDAVYSGLVPDTFKDRPGEEAELVLKGRLVNGVFHVDPNGVTAKCPSKYEEKKEVG
jgi:cytochrome c-type biogenesis protein CcmE